MRVGILGAGFGLYGYLPAILRSGGRPLLLEQYREVVGRRPDLREVVDKVEWAADEGALLERSGALVVSRRPADQVAIARYSLTRPRIGRLLLEKPLAPEPPAARALMAEQKAAGRLVGIGYLFRYTKWGHRLASWAGEAGPGATVRIVWSFRAHHFAHNIVTWKRHHSEGGGALRFYGIHLIALLSELGYDDVIDSQVTTRGTDEVVGWTARFRGPSRPVCEVRVESDADRSEFVVAASRPTGSRLDVRLTQPFEGCVSAAGLDPRVGLLVQACAFLFTAERDERVREPAWYATAIDLWEASEASPP